MKIKSISLANFRGFEHVEFFFQNDINVIAGENGIGKSSILSVLASLLGYAVNDFTKGSIKRSEFSDSDIRRQLKGSANWFQVSGDFEFAEKRFNLAISREKLNTEQLKAIKEEITELRAELANVEGKNKRDREKEEKRIKRNITTLTKLKDRGNEQTSLITASLDAPGIETDSNAAATKALQSFKSELKQNPNQPIAVFFTTKRFFNDSIGKFPKAPPFSMQRAYSNALEDLDVSLKDFTHWFHFALKTEKGSRITERMVEVITEFIPELKKLRIDTTEGIQFLVDKGDVSLPLTDLSDGERGLIAMVFDLTRRLVLANPEREDPITEGEGVVLIDEIELHLHPKWQREVLRRFSDTFKNCQFIATTHSPQVLGEVKARGVRFLERDEDSKKVEVYIPPESFGLDTNRVLDELMGASERNKKTLNDLTELFRLVDDEEFDKAREAMEPLKKMLGEDEPELTRANALIKFLEGKE